MQEDIFVIFDFINPILQFSSSKIVFHIEKINYYVPQMKLDLFM